MVAWDKAKGKQNTGQRREIQRMSLSIGDNKVRLVGDVMPRYCNPVTIPRHDVSNETNFVVSNTQTHSLNFSALSSILFSFCFIPSYHFILLVERWFCV
jgi:hypothetical protein